MMKKLHLTVLIILLGLSGAQAEPVLDFISELLKKPNTLTNWVGETQTQPNGGYIFRFYFDLDADAKNELFLGSSTDLEDEKACSWAVYRQDQSGNYQPIGSDVVFHPTGGFYLLPYHRRPQINTTFVKPPDFGAIKNYALDGAGKLAATTRNLSASEVDTLLQDDKAEEKLKLGVKKTPAVQKVLLAEYLKSEQVQWRPYKAEYSILRQSSDPADAAALSSTQDFMIEDAEALVESRQVR